MPKCNHCGYDELDHAIFCSRCGASLAIAQGNPPTSNFVRTETKQQNLPVVVDYHSYQTPATRRLGVDDLTLIDVLRTLPNEERRKARQLIRRAARKLRKRAKDHGNRSTTSNTLGAAFGGAIGTGGLLAMITGTAPVSIPVLSVIFGGFTVMTIGIGLGHYFSSLKIRFEEQAEAFDDHCEELNDV